MTNPDDKGLQNPDGHLTKPQRKEQMRHELRRKLVEQGSGDSLRVVRKVVAYLEQRPELRTIAIFAALPGEVDLRALPAEVDRVWAFPKVVGEDLVFYQVRSFEDDMSPGAFGIMEPQEGLEEIDIGKVDLFLCPGLGFDLKGGRIGRGKGFYDRMLEQARPDVTKLGVCFDYQVVEEVAMDDHDVRMNGVFAG